MRVKKSIFRILVFMGLLIVFDFALHTPWMKHKQDSSSVRLNANAAVLMSYKNGKILYAKNADQALHPASMSKMMVEYLALQAIAQNRLSWNSRVPVSHYAYYVSSHPGFAHVPLQEGASYTVKELYDAMAIDSANGAAVALAKKIGGTEKHFVGMMNQTAGEMGLDHTHFVNGTGLNNKDLGKYYSVGSPTDENKMSARDLAHLARNLIQKYPEVLNISKKAVAVFNENQTKAYKYYNTDWMLPGRGIEDVSYSGVDGLKTGYTEEAGYCFTGTAIRSDVRMISVVMGTQTKKARFKETMKLFNYGFQRISE